MLHRVERPQYASALAQVVEFEKKLLAWICSPPVAFTFDGAKAAFGDEEEAKWLWERIYRNGKQKGFGNAVSQAIDYVRQDPAAGKRIVACAQNDLEFQHHFEDAQFSFHERHFGAGSITEADLAVFKPLLTGLYQSLFEDPGFPTSIHHDVPIGNLTRKKWNEGFWSVNSQLHCCPSCDGPEPANVRGAIASDVDHFFPRDKYPFLSIHPDNLIPVCLECNTKAHRDLDPLDNDTMETLVDTFHSYERPAVEHIKLCVGFKVGQGINVTIQEQDGSVSKRVRNLVRVLDLETRWASWFERFINTIIGTWHPVTKSEFRDLLEQKLLNDRPLQSKWHQCFVFARLIEYVLNPEQFESLCEVVGL